MIRFRNKVMRTGVAEVTATTRTGHGGLQHGDVTIRLDPYRGENHEGIIAAVVDALATGTARITDHGEIDDPHTDFVIQVAHPGGVLRLGISGIHVAWYERLPMGWAVLDENDDGCRVVGVDMRPTAPGSDG